MEVFVESRTGAQIRSHAQKFFTRIEKEYHAADPMSFIQNMHVPDLENLQFKNETITEQEMLLVDPNDFSEHYSSSNLKPRAFSSTGMGKPD